MFVFDLVVIWRGALRTRDMKPGNFPKAFTTKIARVSAISCLAPSCHVQKRTRCYESPLAKRRIITATCHKIHGASDYQTGQRRTA